MKYFNLYYIAIIGVGVFLWNLNKSLGKEVVAFYGFAETKETEINFNYPVAVGDIKVRPGEYVSKNTPLLDVYRIKSKETLDDKEFKVAELRAKEKIWRTNKEEDLQRLRSKKAIALEEIKTEIEKLERKKAFENSLYDDLTTVTVPTANHKPTSNKIEALNRELTLIQTNYDQQIAATEKALIVGKSPYQIEVNRLNAAQNFEQANKKQYIQITAPEDGLIGNIHCKEAEHIPSYKTLVTFYEPNPTMVKGFLQEDLLLHVALQDSFIVRSTKDNELLCYGTVTGLGSRIIEIPDRLRKIKDLKTYGREVLVSIPAKNPFLQKEKVILEFVHPPTGFANKKNRKPKPIVDLEERAGK